MRGISKPFVVLVISIKEDAFGVIVPIPALPVVGNVFVWASRERTAKKDNKMRRKLFLIIAFLW
jgi:hypothetical protein